MKKRSVVLLMALALGAGTLGYGAWAHASAQRAFVFHDNGVCGMPGSGPDGEMVFGGVGEASLIVDNKNKTMLRCDGEDILNLSGQGQHYNGFPCTIILPSRRLDSTDSQATVSASGHATMHCTFNK